MGGGDMADDGVGEEAKVNIRSANGSKFYVHANLNSTVVNFKSIVAQKCDIPAQQQRLIHKGRIMKDDQTLRSYGLEGDHTVYLLRGFATAAPADSTATTDAGIQNTNSTSTNAGSNVGRRRGRPPFGPSFFPELDPDGPGLGAVLEIEQMQQQLVHNPDMVRDILNIPAVHDLVDNPEIVRNMIINNPQMRDIMDHNPELAHIINDPATLRQTMDAARNPEILREIMRNTDRAMSNIESSPEGFNALRRMYEDLQQPLLNATTLTEDDSSDLESDPFATLVGAQAGRTGTDSSFITPGPENTTNSPAPNTNPLPNPWAFAGTGRTHRDSGALGNPIGNTMADSPGGLFLDLELMEDSVPDLTVSNEANELMQDPVISQTIRNMLSNPQYLNQMLGFNPQLQNVLDSNPQIRDVMQNPEFIRRLATPQIVHELLIYHRGLVSQASEEEARNDGGTGNATAARGLEVLMDMFGGLATQAGITPASRPQGPPEEQYATELSQLQEMGFFDTQENIRALVATAGNVHAAVERLLGI